MAFDFFDHVTLDTAHSRRSPRSEVSDEAIASVRAMLDEALAGGQPQVMGDCTMTAATRGGRCLLATIWKPSLDRSRPVPLISIGVALHSRCGSALWRKMHDDAERYPLAPLETTPEEIPREPWIAARLEAGSVTHVAEFAWLGDFQRVLAWAFLERRQKRR